MCVQQCPPFAQLCKMFQAFAARCVPAAKLRLVNGTSSNNGRLEVFFLGRWGTVRNRLGQVAVCGPLQVAGPDMLPHATSCTQQVCATESDSSFNDYTATQLCALLGLPAPGRAVKGSYWGGGDGFIWVDGVSCDAGDTFSDCVNGKWGRYSRWCNSATAAGVACGAEPSECACFAWPHLRALCATFRSLPWGPAAQIRLANPSADGFGGRLELLFNGQWGTVSPGWSCLHVGLCAVHAGGNPCACVLPPMQFCCNNAQYCSYDDIDRVASVLCNQLGLGTRGRLVDASVFGPGTGPVFLDRLTCYDQARSIDECSHPALSGSRCGHDMDVGLICKAAPCEVPPLVRRLRMASHLPPCMAPTFVCCPAQRNCAWQAVSLVALAAWKLWSMANGGR